MEHPPFVYPSLPRLPSEPASPSPFDLPVSQHRLRLSLDRPLRLDPRPGATLATTLRGAFRASLIHAGCLLSRDDRARAQCRATASAGPLCHLESACPVVTLHAPRSEAQRRDHPSPVIFQQLALAPDLRRIEANLLLWGRAARKWEAVIWSAVERAGDKGLLAEGVAVPFRAELLPTPVSDGTLGQFARALQSRVLGSCTSLFALSHQGASNAAGALLLEFPLAADVPAADLAAIAGGAAHDLVQWDLHDRGAADALGKRGCDELADAARAEAERALRGAGIVTRINADDETVGTGRGIGLGAERLRVDLGQRRSRSNRSLFPLGGLRPRYRVDTGRCAELLPALPWIAVLTLRGGGGKKTFGLGELTLRTEAGEQLAP